MALLEMLLLLVVNGAVTWGVVRTEMKYLRRDTDHAHRRLDGHDKQILKGVGL